MRNRWGIELKRGLFVTCNHPRGGKESGVIKGFERISGYGWRVILDSGFSAGIDDVSETREGLTVDAYFVIDDWCESLNCEGFAVMRGDPYSAIGVHQKDFATLRAAKAWIANHVTTEETVYRVFLARRHGEHRVRAIRTTNEARRADLARSQHELATAYLRHLDSEIAKGR